VRVGIQLEFHGLVFETVEQRFVHYCDVMSSGYPYVARPTPSTPDSTPPRARWDVALAATLLVVSVIGWVVAAGMEFFMLAFTDSCPAETCNADKAFSSVAVALSTAAVVIAIGAVIAIVRIVRRRLGWPFAAAALVLSVAAEVVGLVSYIAAVGYGTAH
jgi:hypothetical protein